jgi:hypothetical protein
VQERHERALFLRSEITRADVGIEMGIRPAAVGIEVDDRFQRRETPIVNM